MARSTGSTAFRGPRNIVGPRESVRYAIPYDFASLDPQSEYFVKVQFLLAQDEPWAKKGFVQMRTASGESCRSKSFIEGSNSFDG